MEFKDFAAWDKLFAFVQKDAEGARFYQKWRNLIDMKTHYDEFVREIPLQVHPISSLFSLNTNT